MGLLRYKFQDERKRFETTSQNNSSIHIATSAAKPLTVRRSYPQQLVLPASNITPLTRTPSNGLSRLIKNFVDQLDPSIDISVQLVGNFGQFLTQVPSRLGTNNALDAAADLFIALYTRQRSRLLKPDSAVLIKHSRALHSLQTCLNDPVLAHASETLCAVMLLLITKVMVHIGNTTEFRFH